MNNLTNIKFPLAPNQLAGKVVLLLGATGTVGQAVAKTLCQYKAEVILSAKQPKPLEKLSDSLTQGDCEPAIQAMNLMNVGIKDMIALSEHIESLYGRLDAVIFCSGKWGDLTPIEHYPESRWLEIMHLNLNVPFLLTKHLIPLLRKTKDSSVIFTLSPLSFENKAYHGAFNCAQKGLQCLMENLQSEHLAGSMRFMGINIESINSPTRRRLYPADPYPDMGLEASAVAPYYAALLTEVGEAFKGKTLHVKDYIQELNSCKP